MQFNGIYSILAINLVFNLKRNQTKTVVRHEKRKVKCEKNELLKICGISVFFL